MQNRFTASLAWVGLSLVILNIFGKGIGFIREIIFAGKFGLTLSYEIFLISSAIPFTINTAVIFLSQHYFIPIYLKIESTDYRKKNLFLNQSLQFFFFGGLIISFVLFLFSKTIISAYLGTDSTYLKDAITIFNLLLISIPFNAGFAIISAYMQSKFEFIFPAIAQIIMNAIIIFIVMLFYDSLNFFVLPISFLISYLTSFLLILTLSREDISLKIKSLIKFKQLIPDIDFIFYLVFIEVLSLSYSIVDRYFYNKIDQGGIAALSYSINIFAIPISIFSFALINIYFSKFSKGGSNQEYKLADDLKKSIGLNFFIMIPITMLLFLLGESFIRLFYERGQFTFKDTLTTFQSLKCYSLSLVFYSSYLIFLKLFYSLSFFRLVFGLSIFAFFLKIILNLIFVESLDFKGLALSTSAVNIFLFGVGLILLTRKLKLIDFIPFTTKFLSLLINASVAALITVIISSVILNQKTFMMFFVEASIFITIYSINSHIINYPEWIVFCKMKNKSESIT